MRKQIIELPVEVLHKGLYVSRLDRPWIDSPFLFQGFEIESEEELAQLRELCKNVYVEITQAEADQLLSGLTSRKPARAPATVPALEELSRNLTARMGHVPPKDPVALKAEVSAARAVYGQARETVGKLFDRLRRGGGLDVKAVEGAVDSMVNSIFRNRDAMGWLARLRSKDDYLYNHSIAASVWALAFARHLGLDKDTMRSVGMGAMVLDIGKTQLPVELLQKAGKPTDAEWKKLRAHVELGVAMLDKDPQATPFMKSMVAMHHERLDGSGYPHGLSGDSITLGGRIAGIVDCYDAMISDRAYAKTLSTYDAVRELKRLGKSGFQAELVELFIQSVGVFPTGTLVELNTGDVGVVIAQNRFRRLRPEIMLVLDAQKKLRSEFQLLDLQLAGGKTENSDQPERYIVKGLEAGAYGIDPQEFFL